QREQRRPDEPAREARQAPADVPRKKRETRAGQNVEQNEGSFLRRPDRERQPDQPPEERARQPAAGPDDVGAEVRPLLVRKRLQSNEVDLPIVLEPERHRQAVEQPEPDERRQSQQD